MRATLLTALAAGLLGAGLVMTAPIAASALPADGAAIAAIGHETDAVITVKHKKKRKPTAAATAKPPQCPTDQEIKRTGQCGPSRSQY